MASIPPNVERHPSRKATWIIYDSAGFAFRGRKADGRDYWRASPSHAAASTDSRFFSASTLRELASKVGASTPSS